jgi:predicted phage tail protein
LDGGDIAASQELLDKIQQLEDEVANLKASKTDEKDAELSELQSTRAKNAELIAALRAKNTTTNLSPGANQDVITPEEDPAKGYSREDLDFASKVAARKGMNLKDYLKSIKKP